MPVEKKFNITTLNRVLIALLYTQIWNWNNSRSDCKEADRIMNEVDKENGKQ